MNDDPLQTVAANRGLVATFIYIVVRFFIGWEFKKTDRIERKLDEHIKDSNIRLVLIEERLAVVAERHRIEDRDRIEDRV